MSSKLSEEALKKELLAQKKRAQARAYLEKHGCGPGRVESVLNTEGESAALNEHKREKAASGDNTLDLLLQRKVASVEVERNREISSRLFLLKQQEEFRNRKDTKQNLGINAQSPKSPEKKQSDEVPKPWQAVVDKTSGDTYYWNKLTNETSWERPSAEPESTTDEDISSYNNRVSGSEERGTGRADSGMDARNTGNATVSADDLPPGWIEVMHSATRQIYYVHSGSGEKMWTRPSCDTVSVSVSSSSGIVPNNISDNHKTTDSKRKSKYTEEQEKEKKRRLLIDPLDPLKGMGKWGDGVDEKMADSTASGELWQQRPYPAPGKILKKKEKAVESNIGPCRP
mmetsp:Transcript_37995/g.38677  ORF Transcript_37995/g.38677 Transcript_37995/m.38677 type:complete len:342 (-) Transcript_37995:83-1108(-)